MSKSKINKNTKVPEIDPKKFEEMSKELVEKLKKSKLERSNGLAHSGFKRSNGLTEKEIKQYDKKTKKEMKYKMYAVMMQMTQGDCEVKEPKDVNSKKHRKWEAWNAQKGMEIPEAELQLEELLENVLPEKNKYKEVFFWIFFPEYMITKKLTKKFKKLVWKAL